ncbi:MAG: DUF2190 family protein [Planctomycetota bacterium]
MSTQITGHVRSSTADAAITKNLVVKNTSTGVDVATAGTDKICGVAITTAAITEQVSVQFTGTVKCTASAAISKGAWVTATTGGKIVTTTTDKNVAVGQAMEAATADGDLIEVQLGIHTLSV